MLMMWHFLLLGDAVVDMAAVVSLARRFVSCIDFVESEDGGMKYFQTRGIKPHRPGVHFSTLIQRHWYCARGARRIPSYCNTTTPTVLVIVQTCVAHMLPSPSHRTTSISSRPLESARFIELNVHRADLTSDILPLRSFSTLTTFLGGLFSFL